MFGDYVDVYDILQSEEDKGSQAEVRPGSAALQPTPPNADSAGAHRFENPNKILDSVRKWADSASTFTTHLTKIMPRTIEEGFRDFLTKLTPSEFESQAAKDHRYSIKTRLEKDFGSVPRFTRIGSFGNGTSISGYSDVDYLACLPAGTLTTDSIYSLQKVRASLDGRFPNTGVRVSCPAVVCPFGTSAAETTEVVPAFYTKDANGYKDYGIANCAGGWMSASPDAHNEYVRSIDNKLNNKLKPLIRFIKAWKYFRDVPISSFYLELRVAKYASTESSIVYDIDVKQFLVQLRASALADMQDPMGVSGYIPACKTQTLKDDAISKLETAATRAEKAREETGKQNISNAFDNWRLLYNYEFPTYYY